jgi:hypothetical protein
MNVWPMAPAPGSTMARYGTPIDLHSRDPGPASDKGGVPRLTLETSYPLMNILWTVLIFMALVIWIRVVIMLLIDVFARVEWP